MVPGLVLRAKLQR